jgi:hypothetical protein
MIMNGLWVKGKLQDLVAIKASAKINVCDSTSGKVPNTIFLVPFDYQIQPVLRFPNIWTQMVSPTTERQFDLRKSPGFPDRQ